jgi:hypothetical protein
MSRPSKPEAPAPFVIAQAEPRRPSGRAILFAGVAAACVLGVGMGLWARPGMHERLAAQTVRPATASVAPAASHRLEIVVDDHPRAARTPLDVLPPGLAAAAPQAAPPPAVQPQFAPARSPDGLIRTHAPVAPAGSAASPHEGPSLRTFLPSITAAFAGARLVLTKLERPAEVAAAPPSAQEPAAKPDRRAELAKAQAARELQIAEDDAARAQAHRAALAKAEVAAEETAKAKAHEAELARAQAAKVKAREVELARAEAAKAAAAKAEAHRLALAKTQAAKVEAHRVALARAEATKAEAAHEAAAKQAQAREAKAQKAEQVRLAKAEARAKAAQREEARLEALADAAEAKKRAQLVRLAHALAHAVTGRDRTAVVEQAKVDRKHARAAAREAKLEQASARKRHEPPHLVAAAHARPKTEVVPPPPPSGLMRVSTTPRCASRDPGAALVCADPGLSAAERQLSRAYQGARAAGVPDAELEMGQQRWLAARSAAAREAPWAVRDVYMARIAELNGQAKEAQGGY